MDYKEIIFEKSEQIGTITLNRPERLNAFTQTMGAEMRDALIQAENDPEIRVTIITGAGRGFCAGADLSELQDASTQDVSDIISDQSLTDEQKTSIMMGQKMEEELNPENPDNIRADFRKRYSYLMAINKPILPQ